MSIRPALLVLDLDGTALGGHEPYACLPPEFVTLLDELDQRGIAWTTNTTWGLAGQWEMIRNSNLRSTPAMLCGESGRAIGTILNGVLMDDPSYAVEMQARDQAFREESWPMVRQVLATLLNEDIVTRLSYDQVEPQAMIELSSRTGCADEMWRLLAPLIDTGLYYTFGGAPAERVALLPRHMNKAEGLRAMQARLRVTPAQTIVAGDGINDLHMLTRELAGWLVCPANAAAVVKEQVLREGGFVSELEYSWGVADGVRRILD